MATTTIIKHVRKAKDHQVTNSHICSENCSILQFHKGFEILTANGLQL